MISQLPIIDAHHHLWDPRTHYHPWLVDRPLIDFRYGDYSKICQPFLPADYRAVSRRFNVVGSITMEGEWDPNDPLGETRWLKTLIQKDGMPSGHVAQAWLDAEDAEAVLAAQAAFGFVKGVRHKPNASPQPAPIEWGAPGSLSCLRWQKGYRLLAEYDLRFDLQAPWWHLPEALALAERYPETPIVLNHTGLPTNRSPDALRGWRENMRLFSQFPGAWVKISGLGIAGKPWCLEDNRSIILETIEIFGINRCLFASNFPVDGLCGSFDTIYGGYLNAVAKFSDTEQKQLFQDNALACYGLEIAR